MLARSLPTATRGTRQLRPRAINARSLHASRVHRLFIQTEPTPNEHALKFKPTGHVVVPSGRTYEFTNASVGSAARAAKHGASSPLARRLLAVPGVRSVFFGGDFISVNKVEDMEWGVIKPEIYAAVMDFYTSGLPIVNEPTADEATTSTTNASTVDDEIVLMIRELLDSRIRPSVQEDGGDIEFVDFNHTTGLLRLTMQGSCRGCSSSAVTLKSGIENMMRHYIPEVKTVEQVLDEAEQVANDEFQKLERSLEGGESVTGKK